MLATPTVERGNMPAMHGLMTVPNYADRKLYTVDEFMDDLAKRLGKHYGLNDIREALQ